LRIKEETDTNRQDRAGYFWYETKSLLSDFVNSITKFKQYYYSFYYKLIVNEHEWTLEVKDTAQFTEMNHVS